MSKILTLSIFEIVGSPLCVASDDGQKIHDRIAAALKVGVEKLIPATNHAPAALRRFLSRGA